MYMCNYHVLNQTFCGADAKSYDRNIQSQLTKCVLLWSQIHKSPYPICWNFDRVLKIFISFRRFNLKYVNTLFFEYFFFISNFTRSVVSKILILRGYTIFFSQNSFRNKLMATWPNFRNF